MLAIITFRDGHLDNSFWIFANQGIFHVGTAMTIEWGIDGAWFSIHPSRNERHSNIFDVGLRVRVLGLGTGTQWGTSFRSGDHIIRLRLGF